MLKLGHNYPCAVALRQGADLAEIKKFENEFGILLPREYKDILLVHDGALFCPSTSWVLVSNGEVEINVKVEELSGISGRSGLIGEYGSSYMIQEWGYLLVELTLNWG